MTNGEAINELQSAIDLIKQDGKDWLDKRDIPILEMAISALEAQEWIPVPERLPEVGRSVLLSRRSMGTREGCLQADGKWWQYRWNEMLNADQVTAWMPLPEPYRAERRTDEGD